LVNRLPGVAYPLFRAIQEQSGLDSELAAFGSMPVSSADVAGRRLDAQIVSGSYFHVLRARPFVGRLLGASDDQIGRPPVAVVSYDLWRGGLGSDPGIVGRRLRLNGAMFTVVGVAARRFAGIDGGSIDIWVPAATAPQIGLGASALRDENLYGMAQALGTTVLVRVAAADSLPAVMDRLRSLGTRLQGADEERASVRPMRDFIARELDDARTKATVFAALAACALCIAGLGVYAVQTYNTALRTKELAIRSALGSPASRLTILLVSELGTFVLGGILVGGAIAYVLYAPLSGILFDARDSRPMLAFGLGALLFVLTGLGALMSPLRKALTTPVASILRSE